MTDYEAMSAIGIAASVRGGATQASTIADAASGAIARQDGALGAFTAVLAERSAAEARAVDARLAAGEGAAALAGVPYAVKNLFDIAGVVTLAGAKLRRTAAPAAADADAVRRLGDAGGVLMGALNMDEFAYGFVTENAHYGTTRNPHDHARIAGGSSGGSAAAVASGMVALALGSDTNGSIRVPASLCGVYGLKPTYGRLSRRGSFPFVDSFDHVGPFARSAADLALCYDVLQGADPHDPAQVPRPDEPSLPGLELGLAGLRAAVLGGWFAQGASDDARDAVDRVAAALGATRVVELARSDIARAAAFVITAAEGANLHLEDLKVRAEAFDPATRARFQAGGLLPAQYTVQAQRFRRWYRDQALEVLLDFDVLIAPATPCTAPMIGQATMVLDGKEVPVRANLGIYTQPISFIGLPVVAVPVLRPAALPIGVQIIARPWAEALALRVAHRLEQLAVTGFRPFQ